ASALTYRTSAASGSLTCICWATMRRVVFKASVFRRIVRRGDHNTVSDVFLAIAVVDKNGAGDNGCGSEAVVGLNYGFDFVGRHVFAHKERAVDVLGLSIITDGLSDNQDVGFVKRGV